MDFDLSTIVGIAVALVILVLLFTTRKSKVEEEATPEAPYKVETPVVPTVTETVTIKEVAPVTEKPAKKAPAKKAPAKKTKAAVKAPEKPVEQPVEQPVEKKPAAKKTRVKKSA